MKLSIYHPHLRRGQILRDDGGFTLAELLIAITVFTMLLGGIMFAHLFGLSMFQITETKLNATADARKLIGTMANEIRGASSTAVGDVIAGEIVRKIPGEKQQGSGLIITNNGNCIMYFVNPSDKTFRRATSTPGSAVIVAESVTNANVFSAQDYLGTVLTNNENKVIHMKLEFYQAARHMQGADYYKLETSVTRRGSSSP